MDQLIKQALIAASFPANEANVDIVNEWLNDNPVSGTDDEKLSALAILINDNISGLNW